MAVGSWQLAVQKAEEAFEILGLCLWPSAPLSLGASVAISSDCELRTANCQPAQQRCWFLVSELTTDN